MSNEVKMTPIPTPEWHVTLPMGAPLQAVSNIIELKSDKKYLLVFRGDAIQHGELDRVSRLLHEEGIRDADIVLSNGNELEVIEVPVTQGEGEA